MAGLFRRIEHEEMGTGPLVRTLLTLALPAAASGVLGSLFELVDRLFISWLGPTQISGVSMVMPIVFMVYAVGSAVGIGVAALVSRHLGAGEAERARRVLNHALWIALCVGSALALTGHVFADELLRFFGAPEEMLHTARSYFGIVIFGAVFMHVGIATDAGLRAQGNTITPMKVMALGNLLNIVLDPLFIFGAGSAAAFASRVAALEPARWVLEHYGLGLGVRGAALATLLSRSTMVLVLLSRLWSRRTRLQPSSPWRTRPRPRARTIGRIYAIGLPSTISHVGMAASNALINKLVISIQPVAVGVLGIAMALQMFAFVPIFGLFSAVVAMVGYNFGAGQLRRCRRTVWAGCALAACPMGAVGAVLMGWPRLFLGLFTQDALILAIGQQHLRVVCWTFALIGCDIMISAGFQGLGRTHYSMFCQIWRTLIVKVPLAWAMGRAWGLLGVWWSFPASSIACFIMSVWLMRWLFRRLEKRPPAAERPSPEELEAVAFASEPTSRPGAHEA